MLYVALSLELRKRPNSTALLYPNAFAILLHSVTSIGFWHLSLKNKDPRTMNRIFGTSASKKPKPTLQDAISSSDTRMQSIEVKIKKLDAELGRYKEQMSRLRAGPGKGAIEQRALQTLKQKKMYESQLAQIQQQTFNMESAALATENLRNTMATVDAMKLANKEIKKQYGKIDINKIENMHYEMEDLLEQANEIQESLGRSYAVPDELDEADLQAELDALALEEDDESTSYLADLNKVPDYVDEEPVELGEEAKKEPEAVKNTA
ncbi:vacuolar sorting-associated 60 [Pyrrhoderma noxium]|uniref:Vacuolar sorting-associated 60 n=1 Tax=Pyrrhoderma noxium TaxID=2282107 RepID=A0A286ULI4_9AGAM|nr:vacuolar sorting-associated 60 [Pyrrhoderma noxium]